MLNNKVMVGILVVLLNAAESPLVFLNKHDAGCGSVYPTYRQCMSVPIYMCICIPVYIYHIVLCVCTSTHVCVASICVRLYIPLYTQYILCVGVGVYI